MGLCTGVNAHFIKKEKNPFEAMLDLLLSDLEDNIFLSKTPITVTKSSYSYNRSLPINKTIKTKVYFSGIFVISLWLWALDLQATHLTELLNTGITFLSIFFVLCPKKILAKIF